MHNNQPLDLVELRIDFYHRYNLGYKVFAAKDGEHITNLLQSLTGNS